ncbi:MAG: exodeoxyribonuclease III [Methanobacteriaceae archaeon]|nr:exodeoxyribonuclease III [Methanobacteriaceae archaeon]
MKIEILSWNVNGLRARYNNGHLDWLQDENPDIFCLQEIKATKDQVKETLNGFDDYHSFYSSSTITPGFSGVAIYSKIKPNKVIRSFGDGKYQEEGRILKAEYDDFILLNIYFPTGANSDKNIQEKNLHHKLMFYESFLNLTESLSSSGERVLVCGDFNIAHKPLDLANPKNASKKPGFLQIERAIIDRLISQGYTDTFREFNQEPHHYTWWSNMYNLREKNIGMRLDHFFATLNLKDHIKDAYIRPDIMGSDHCPIGIDIQI